MEQQQCKSLPNFPFLVSLLGRPLCPHLHQDYCCQSYLGQSGASGGQELAGRHHIVCSQSAAEIKMEKVALRLGVGWKLKCGPGNFSHNVPQVYITISFSIFSGVNLFCKVFGSVQGLTKIDIYGKKRQGKHQGPKVIGPYPFPSPIPSKLRNCSQPIPFDFPHHKFCN